MIPSYIRKFKLGDLLIVSLIIISLYISDNYCFSNTLGIKGQIMIYGISLILLFRILGILHFSTAGIIIGICVCSIIVSWDIISSPYKNNSDLNRDKFFFIVYAVPFIQYLFFKYCKKIVYYIANLFVAIICVVLYFISNSRAFLGAITIELFAFHLLTQRNKKEILYTSITLTIITICLFVYLFTVRPASVIGRILIWKICFSIISKNIWTGLGINGFINEYMLYQRDYLQDHSLPLTMKYLVDDVTTPYSEPLLIIINYGIIVFSIVVTVFGLLIYLIYKRHNRYRTISLCGIMGYLIISCCSYPFRYPVSWLFLILFFTIGLIDSNQKRNLSHRTCVRRFSMTFICAILSFMIALSNNYHKWHEAVSCSNQSNKMDSFIKLNNTMLKRNPDFLYDYAYFLYQQSLYKECAAILEGKYSSKNYRNTMFKGEIQYQLANYDKSVNYYILASQMIPNRFSPLFNIVSIYEELGNEKMLSFADSIVRKPIKVQSKEVSFMKDYCKDLLSEIEKD